MSEEKTLITHATTGQARFLNYDISIARNNERRAINGMPKLRVPKEVARKWKRRYTCQGKSRHRPELADHSDYGIVMTYHLELQGVVNYYTLAHDVARKLYPVKWVAMQSLVKTLAARRKRKVPWVYQRYYRKSPQGVMSIMVEAPRENRKPLTAWFGAKPIRHRKWAVISDKKVQLLTRRNEIVTRLLADECEVCGSGEEIQVHHIRKLKDLERRYRGRRNPPESVVKMVALRRKTLVVCEQCHRAIHAGTYDGPRLT